MTSTKAQAIVDQMVALETSANLMYQVICGAMVLLMQVGFAFLEAGCVRYKNLSSIIIKIFLNTSIGMILWWILGYGIAFGVRHTSFVGQSNFVGEDYDNSPRFHDWVFQTAVAVAANSIVSGGAAERMTYFGYMGLSTGFNVIIYPFAAHWGFDPNGWLVQLGYRDFAGSGTVHAVGGIGALMTTLYLRPRLNRFNPRYSHTFEPNNPTFICLGALTLWTCWVFFNAGSTLGVSDGRGAILGMAAMNTMIAGSSGALTVFIMNNFIKIYSIDRWSLIMLSNGNLAGLVAVTGSCNNIESWAAFLIGILGGFTYLFIAKVLHILKIDDPVDAIPIHLGCGIIGANVGAWFDMDYGILYGHGGKQFGIQILGTLVYLLWSGGFHFIFLGIIQACDLLRVSVQVEKEGLDVGISCKQAYNYTQLPLRVKSKHGKEDDHNFEYGALTKTDRFDNDHGNGHFRVTTHGGHEHFDTHGDGDHDSHGHGSHGSHGHHGGHDNGGHGGHDNGGHGGHGGHGTPSGHGAPGGHGGHGEHTPHSPPQGGHSSKPQGGHSPKPQGGHSLDGNNHGAHNGVSLGHDVTGAQMGHHNTPKGVINNNQGIQGVGSNPLSKTPQHHDEHAPPRGNHHATSLQGAQQLKNSSPIPQQGGSNHNSVGPVGHGAHDEHH